jgi:hypothetical protein
VRWFIRWLIILSLWLFWLLLLGENGLAGLDRRTYKDQHDQYLCGDRLHYGRDHNQEEEAVYSLCVESTKMESINSVFPLLYY